MPIPTFRAVAPDAVQSNAEYDALVLVTKNPGTSSVAWLRPLLESAAKADSKVVNSVSFHVFSSAPGERLIVAPTGPLNRDWDDVRCIGDAANQGIARAVSAGARKPLMLFADDLETSGIFRSSPAVALLGVLDALYVPIQRREFHGESVAEPVSEVGWCWMGEVDGDATVRVARAVEAGRRVARDICGGDPERMPPPAAAAYIREQFSGLANVSIDVQEDWSHIEREYPLLHSVGRACLRTPRHHPRVVRLEYTPPGPVERQIFFAGKGIVYDTGGADLKVGGVMAGMKRDKGGAAAAAGFVRSLAELQPTNIRVVAILGFVRNSIGAECFVADEVIVGHSGKRVLVVNTDAEGRMVMADILSHIREELKAAANDATWGPLIRSPGRTVVHSIATLTGHAALAVGPYSAVMDNGPAAEAGVGSQLAQAGHVIGDPLEISSIRREDHAFVAPKTAEYDVLQCNTAPSSRTPRGHQFPAAFLIHASGLSDHGKDSELPIAYTHLDIAGSASSGTVIDGRETGRPVAALVAHYALSL